MTEERKIEIINLLGRIATLHIATDEMEQRGIKYSEVMEFLSELSYPDDTFKRKMAGLAKKYHISHQRDIEWHNFVAEVEQLTNGQPMPDCAELITSTRALYFDIGFCIAELLRARKEGNEQHECNALSRMEGLMNESQQQLSCIIDYLERQAEQKPAEWSEEDEMRREGIIQWLREYQKKFNPEYDSLSIESIESLIDWFKSLRPSKK